ncbi:hypothetical protein PI125_g3504 [Phytophthora idaei]|nr:hypothetical protein PI125_g3504 [Phytophthora idaei]KAG3168053.1 hypothetical protein PI126_g3461 [Phytophthora idaei]
MTALTTSANADTISSTSPLRVPIMTFIAGIGVNLVGNKQDPLHGPSMEDPGRPIWNLTPEQQSIVEQAEIVMIDSHGGGPVFMAPKETSQRTNGTF